MKKLFLSIAVTLSALAMTSCQEDAQWEYRVLTVEGEQNYNGDFFPMSFTDPSSKLNALGKEGWEVVTSYTEVQTVHPNYGNSEYVTGLQPNTRTSTINFVLKRKLMNSKK